MPVEILAAGNSAANSTAVTVTAAAPVTVTLKYTGGLIPNFTVIGNAPTGTPGAIYVQSQDDGGGWNATGEVLSAQNVSILLNRPGVYRVRRLSIEGAPSGIGVFRSDP